MSKAPISFECRIGETFPFLGRVRHDASGEWATPSNTATVTVTITKQDGTVTVDGESLTLASVLYANRVTGDPRWERSPYDGDNVNEEEPGFNFEWTTGIDAFPSYGWYRAEFTFTDSNSKVTKIVYEGAARG